MLIAEERIIRAQVQSLETTTDHLLDRASALPADTSEYREILRLLGQTVGRAKTKRLALRALRDTPSPSPSALRS